MVLVKSAISERIFTFACQRRVTQTDTWEAFKGLRFARAYLHVGLSKGSYHG